MVYILYLTQIGLLSPIFMRSFRFNLILSSDMYISVLGMLCVPVLMLMSLYGDMLKSRLVASSAVYSWGQPYYHQGGIRNSRRQC